MNVHDFFPGWFSSKSLFFFYLAEIVRKLKQEHCYYIPSQSNIWYFLLTVEVC